MFGTHNIRRLTMENLYNKYNQANSTLGFLRQNLKYCSEKVQVGKDQEKAQSEKDSHSKNRGGKKPN